MSNRLTALLGSFLISPIIALALVASSAMNAQPDTPKSEKIDWGKEVNGLAVSIAPAKDEGKFILRWKNVGKDTLELPWVRFGSNAVYTNRDDLLGHVSLKNPDGKLTPARTYKFPIIGGPPYRPRTVILDPDKVHEETIDLWNYVEKQAGEGRYQLSIELEIRAGFAPSRKGVKYWTGKVQSNVLEVKLAAKAEGRTEPAKAAEEKAEDGFVPLFTGKNFAGWKIVGGNDAGKAWVIHQNAIVKRKFQSMLACPGKPASCLMTAKSYKNYVLRFDWLFEGGEAKALKDDTDYKGDSGCLVHVQPPYKLWPKAMEIAGKPKEFGKLLPLESKLVGDLKYDQAAKNKALDKTNSAWNTTEITCGADGSIQVALNGVVICTGKSDLTEGAIGFKADGPKVWYANIEFKQLK